jgi:hypothetical protein
MKRFAICALAVLAMTGVANAQIKVWIQGPNGGMPAGPGHVCVEVSHTAVIELWVEVYPMSYSGRVVAFDAIMTAYSAANYLAGVVGGEHFSVVGFSDHGPWGSFGRKDPRGLLTNPPTPPNDSINLYQFLGVDENQPFTTASGLAPGIYFVDNLYIHGEEATQPAPCPPVDYATADVITFSKTASPGGFWIWPDYFATYGYMDLTVAMGTGYYGSKTAPAIPFYVCVTPEPTALSLLVLGGLAAFRRR